MNYSGKRYNARIAVKKSRKIFAFVLLPLALAAGCGYALLSVPVDFARTPPPDDRSEILRQLRVPEDVAAGLFSAAVPAARQIAVGEDGWVFVGTRGKAVYALKDENKDGRADIVRKIADKLNAPHGVAYADGKLYVGEIHRIRVAENVLQELAEDRDVQFAPVISDLPTSGHHGLRHLKIGPDKKLYVALGAPCNICQISPHAGVIRRYDLDGKNGAVYANGVRNAVGMDFHPETGELWFTDNGRDWLGDDLPGDELNRAAKPGAHFGFPYCHQGDFPDPEFGDERSCDEFEPPVLLTGAHVANLGMAFTPARNALPARYQNGVFIALHGSWNRSVKAGYAVHYARTTDGGAEDYQPFATGWLADDKESVFGRPVDAAFAEDGALLISDDYAGAIWRFVQISGTAGTE